MRGLERDLKGVRERGSERGVRGGRGGMGESRRESRIMSDWVRGKAERTERQRGGVTVEVRGITREGLNLECQGEVEGEGSGDGVEIDIGQREW